MKIDIKILAIVGLFAYILLSNILCNNRMFNISGVEDSIDTISVITNIDTVTKIVHDTIEREVIVYQDKIVHDAVYYNDSTPSVVRSTTTHSDSLVDITVEAYSETPVQSFNIKYTPKFPIYITKFITKESEVVLEEKAKFKVFVGASVMGSKNSFGFGPLAHFKARRDIIYTLGYDLIQEEVQVGIAAKISFKRKYK